MQSKSKNPFFINAKLEESYTQHRMYKCLRTSECDVTIRSQDSYVELDGGEIKRTKKVAIFLGNESETIETVLVMTQREALEFANYILNMVDTLEKDEGSEADNETN